MFERLSIGWSLTVQSFRVLRADTRLVVFPLLSSLSCLLVLASFVIPLWNTPQGQALLQQRGVPHDPLSYAVLFAFYFVNYFVIVFFNAALITCAIVRFKGGEPTLGDGLRMAAERLPQIVAWALVSATIGLVLRIIESRSERVGQIVAGLLGAAWSVLTYFAVPALVVEKASPIDAVKRSAAILKKTWGEAIAARISASMIFFIVGMVCLIPLLVAMALIVVGAAQGLTVLVVAGIGLVVLVLIVVSLVSSTLYTILLAAIYLYAAEGRVPGQFDAGLLRNAFGSKR